MHTALSLQLLMHTAFSLQLLMHTNADGLAYE
jgi:hypothetical protein